MPWQRSRGHGLEAAGAKASPCSRMLQFVCRGRAGAGWYLWVHRGERGKGLLGLFCYGPYVVCRHAACMEGRLMHCSY